MKTVNMPGFTAELSLHNVNDRYQVAAHAPHYGGVVQPAISIAGVAKQDYSIFSDTVSDRLCWGYRCHWVDLSPGLPFPPRMVRVCGFEWVC